MNFEGILDIILLLVNVFEAIARVLGINLPLFGGAN